MPPIRPALPMMRPAAGLDVLPLATPTLRPATHTNTAFVGRDEVWIVDPATPYHAAQEALLGAVEAVSAAGRTPRGIVLTHHHHDHVAGATWLREQTGLSIWAHPTTAGLLDGEVQVDRPLVADDLLAGSDHGDDWWHVLHTPGHAPGHLALWEPERRLLIGGDMVASVGTILVAPPDGHMATYIAQLERLAALQPTVLVPSHGDVIGNPVAVLEHYISHRLAREARVLATLDGEPLALMAITEKSYPDVPKALHGLATGSTLAHLIKLAEEGRAQRLADDRWVAR